MSTIVSNCQHCDDQQFQTLSCVYTIHDFLSSKVRFIHTSTATGSHSCSETTRTPRVHLVDRNVTEC